MSDNNPLRAAAIAEAARNAGAYDPALVAIAAAEDTTLSPAETVTALKATKPYLFGPKHARDMSPAEYREAKLDLMRNTERARVGLPPRAKL